MRPVVALLGCRPETIADDYRRLLHLLGFPRTDMASEPVLAVNARHRTWRPGRVCPPWQVGGVLQNLGVSAAVLPVGPGGMDAKSGGAHGVWQDVVARSGSHFMESAQLTPAPYRPAGVFPALEGSLPRGIELSPHLRERPLLLLSAMELGSGGTLETNTALLASLLAPERITNGSVPQAEVLAEVVGLAREVFSSLVAVTDATVWSVARRGGKKAVLSRNLLVAGNDPVAVDSVLAHLAGLRPQDTPWLALSQERGFGVSALEKIKIVGEPRWLALDFQIPQDTLSSGRRSLGLPGRKGSAADELGTGENAWDRLFKDYQSGVIP